MRERMTSSLDTSSRQLGRPVAQHELNVTPMLDVLLVLLVIFMTSVVGLHHTMDAQLPEPCAVMCVGGPEPIVLRFVFNAQAQIIGIGMGPLSQTPAPDPA